MNAQEAEAKVKDLYENCGIEFIPASSSFSKEFWTFRIDGYFDVFVHPDGRVEEPPIPGSGDETGWTVTT